MKHFINLIEYLESNHHYSQVDELIRVALDMTDVLTEDNKLGKGLYGEFHSDFSREQKQKLKNQFGNIPNNVGIKKYKINQYDAISWTIDNIGENLTFIYVAPYISQNTDLLTPVYNGTISLSAMITNRINITQKMPGSTLESVIDALREIHPNVPSDISFMIRWPMEDRIEKKLRAIGVSWPDIHDNNYLLDKTTVQEFLEWAKDNAQSVFDGNIQFDLSRNASLFDFGHFEVHRNTPPGMQLESLKEKIKNQDNKFMGYIVEAINHILI